MKIPGPTPEIQINESGLQFEYWYFFKGPRCFYCSAKVENIVITYERGAKSLRQDQGRG